ncbi:MAG: hypothetical protein MJA83_01155, partial [Gammaproteobacteria bacterium]|nr:hypothetical protein [Gammaproteobacteria bacterium]
MRGFNEVISVLSNGSGIPNGPSVQRRIKEALRHLAQSGPRYKCRECGFTGKTLYWQCPSCKQWNTTRPYVDFSFSGSTEAHLRDFTGRH